MATSRTKKIIIGVAIVAVAAVGATMIGGKDTPAPTTGGLVSNRVDSGIAVGTQPTAGNDEFLATLLSIRSIRVDTSLFKNPAFLYLKDHPVVLGTETVGRSNPFAPIGNDPVFEAPAGTISVGGQQQPAAPSSSSQTAGVETLQPGKITAKSAEFGAVVSFPNGTGPVVLVFDYGTTEAVPYSTESVILESGDRILLPLTGLTAGTRYYVRASLLYGSQTLRGSVMSFTTKTQ
ncbi:MAG TPA: hypothetical protein VLB02_01075 [Candidatus Paceibacterota bacterium]|nr:hypothetical protein [Candidatus Paceibacterota bacterium]